jgi:putative component of membrane protein insertase Oxa1/YidC/SpoIIIJ protein YidD
MAKRLGLVGRLAIYLIEAYQATNPVRPTCCRFYPSCSSYAKQAIIVRGALIGLLLILWRLLRCWPGLPCKIEHIRKR